MDHPLDLDHFLQDVGGNCTLDVGRVSKHRDTNSMYPLSTVVTTDTTNTVTVVTTTSVTTTCADSKTLSLESLSLSLRMSSSHRLSLVVTQYV